MADVEVDEAVLAENANLHSADDIGDIGASDPNDRSLNGLDNRRLMNLIRQQKVLYEYSNSHDQRSRDAKDEAWRQITHEFGGDIPTAELTRRYKNIRTAFGRFLRRSIKRQDGRVRSLEKSPWGFMAWLKPYIKHKFDYDEENFGIIDQSSSKLQHQSPSFAVIRSSPKHDYLFKNEMSGSSATMTSSAVYDNDSGDRDRNMINDNDYTVIIEQQTHPNTNRGVSKETDSPTYYEAAPSQPRQKRRRYPSTEQPSDCDEDALFLQSLIPQLRRIRPQLKFAVKTNILKVLHDGEFGMGIEHND